MIYINNNSSTIVRTESWLDVIPSKVYIKFDDIIVGEFDNVSLIPTYIMFEIPQQTIESLKLENMEYQMKIYKDFALFKMELVSVVSNRLENLVEKDTTLEIKMKEII